MSSGDRAEEKKSPENSIVRPMDLLQELDVLFRLNEQYSSQMSKFSPVISELIERRFALLEFIDLERSKSLP